MRISVVIPCRNAAPYLAATLRSVLNQTRRPDEVIVVDNGSTDSSRDVAAAFAPEVRLIEEARPGAARARLTGTDAASGDALMYLDADDLLGPTVIEALGAVLADHPEAVAVCPWMRYRQQGEAWIAGPPSCAPRRSGQDDLAAWLTGWWHPPCSVLWSRPAYQRSGGWDPEASVDDDGDVMMRGFLAGNRLVASARGTAYYRRLPANQTSLSGRQRQRSGVEARLAVYDGIRTRLSAEGRLGRYAGPLAEAYLNVAKRDCADHPDLRDRCFATVRDLPWRPTAALAGTTAFRGAYAARRRLQPGGPPVHPGRAKTPLSSPPPRRVPLDGSPQVSVIIPAFNRAALLERAIASVLAQSHADFELIVVDDASTDDTADRVGQIDDPRLRYLRQERNRGVAAARNRGIREARGALLAFLDSDDEWMVGALAAHVNLFRNAPSRLGLARSAVLEVSEEQGESLVRLPGDGLLFAEMLRQNLFHAGGSNAVMRREVVDAVGLFDETLPAVEDWEYFLRISRFYELGYIDEVLVRYRDVRQDRARRSRNLAANIAARNMLASRYAYDLRRLGLTQEFRLGTARRHLVPPYASRIGAAGHILGAMRARPLSAAPFRLMPLFLTPRWARDAFRQLRTAPRTEP